MRLTLLSLVLLSSMTLLGQSRFYAETDGGKVLEGKTFTVKFTVENGKIDGFTPPDFRPFQVLAGPLTSTSVSIVNGRRSSKASTSYTLLANKVGKFTLPSAKLKQGNKSQITSPISIEVIKATKTNTESEQYFAKMVVSDSLVYPGQQVILDFQLYTLIDINNYDLLNEPDYDGFFAEELRVKGNFDRAIVNGEQYYTKSLKRVALFPQQVGTYKFDPVNLTLGIPTGKRRGFFQDVRSEGTRTNGLTIQVANLPDGAPSSFSGAIGKYVSRVDIKKQTITTDDAISFTIVVHGNGDSRYVTAPKITLPDNLELYDPNTIRDDVSIENGQKVHTKAFEYLIVAQEPGRYTIDPDFTYLDTDSNAYVTLSPRKLNFNVLKGTGVANRPVTVEAEETIGPINETTRLRKTSRMFFGTMPYFLLLGLFGAGIVGLYSYRQRLIKSGAFDSLVQRKKHAKLKVIQELDSLLAAVTHTDRKARTEIISNKFNAYITQKFANTDIQFTDQQVVNLLKEQSVSDTLVDRTTKFLSKCQMAIYAGVASDTELYDEVVAIIEDIDRESSTGEIT